MTKDVMSRYYLTKNKIRGRAILWQLGIENENYSYGELAEDLMYFEKMGKRYGLLKEFRENGII